MTRPRLALTMGDPAGVGPETIAGAWQHAHLHRHCRLTVVGHPKIMQRALELRGATTEVVPIEQVENEDSSVDCLPCLAAVSDEAVDVPPGRIDPRAGQAAYQALITAARLALENRIDALVTAPLNKAALHAAGHAYPGHTELLAELCGVKRFAMMLYLRDPQRIAGPSGLGIAHVTLHMALRNVFAHLHPDAVLEKIRLCHTVMRTIRAGDGGEDVEWSQAPRVAVCALNPHGGEDGLFGDEEQRVIRPAVEEARRQGLYAVGPLPCDTLMVRAASGEFDGVVAMYHDQGHIALKLLGMHRAVNITLGLPIIRTSVAHGTAFDLAWQGRAETSGMIAAVETATRLVRHRQLLTWS